MTVAALITAAGSGTRLGSRKQFLDLTPSERLIDRAVATVSAASDWVGVILPAEVDWDGAAVDAVCQGGSSRHASLKAGLALVPESAKTVLVHSASHPLASPTLVARLLDAVAGGADGAVPFLEAVDVVKRRDESGRLTTVGREGLGAAQCPMAFARHMLDRAFAEVDHGTEESQLVEAIGGRVISVPGEVSNIHVVDLEGLAAARALAKALATGDVSS